MCMVAKVDNTWSELSAFGLVAGGVSFCTKQGISDGRLTGAGGRRISGQNGYAGLYTANHYTAICKEGEVI